MPAGAHSVKKPSQHSLIIITTFAYIFSVSGGSAAALKTIKNMTIRIPDGNAFRIRLTARNLISGEYTEAADLSNIDNLVINYVRRGIRFPHAYTIDEEGRATVADAGTLDCGFYGIELTGYYGGEKFRFYGKDLFEITTDTTDVIDPSNLIDIEITVKLNASGVSKDYVDHAINGMEASMVTMQDDLRDEIAEAGKVDDVKVNGVSVVSGKKAIITVPTKVSDLNNDLGYQNEQQVQQKVDAAKITSADISVDGGTGTPSGSAGVSGNQLVIALHNIKGEKGDTGEPGATGPQGPQGESFQPIEDVSGLVLAHTTGQDKTKAMSQKGVTDAVMDSVAIDTSTVDPSIVGTLVNKYITSNKWTSGSSSKNGYFIPVTPYKRYRLTLQDKAFHFFFTRDMYSNIGNAPHYAGGLTSDPGWTSAGTVLVTAPSDAAYLWCRNMNASGDSRLPEIVEIGTMKERIDKLDKIIFEQIPLDMSDSVNAYVSATIGSIATYTSSSASISYKNIIPVAKGFQYSVNVQNAEEPASTGERDCVIVDDDNIIIQTMKLKTNGGEVNVLEFTANGDGHFVLCCDKLAVSIEIRGYKAQGDINTLFGEIAKKKNSIIYSNSATFGHTTYVDPNDFHFKAGKTYVFVIQSTTATRCSCGISGISETETFLPWTEGFDVAKFKFDEDTVGKFWVWNGASSSQTFSYIVEEWDDTDLLRLSDVGTIRVAAYNSRGSDKYISKYVCRKNENSEVEIQQAINDLPNGGKVQLADGNYVISEVQDTGDEEIGYLGIDLGPQVIRRHIEICGVQKSVRIGTGGAETGVGAVIWLSAAAVSEIDNDTHITVIGALPIDNEYMRLPRGINLTIKNVGFNIPDNTKAIRVIDAEYCSALQVENVDMGITNSGTYSTSPNPECIGLRGLGGWNYGIYYILRCIKVHGFGVAFDLGGEHLLMEQCAVRYSGVPYRFYKYGDVAKMAHPQTMINCCEESCQKSIVFGSNSKHPAVSIIDYNIEWRSGDEWNRSQKAIEESPGDIHGRINFTANRSNYVNISDIQFWEQDGSGSNFLTKNDADLLRGTTAQRPTYPYFGQRYYDTTLGVFVTYNGSEWI